MSIPAAGGAPAPHPLSPVLKPDSYFFDLNLDGTRIAADYENPASRELWVIENFATAIGTNK